VNLLVDIGELELAQPNLNGAEGVMRKEDTLLAVAIKLLIDFGEVVLVGAAIEPLGEHLISQVLVDYSLVHQPHGQ
jgi:hypothetical protein